MPLVSVIIPNYNHATYLKQRIDSVLNQTFIDFEVIILDDCSTDNSKEIIEQYKEHEKITAIEYNNVNGGNTFKQWDKGIRLAAGEYIWMAESDDWSEPSFLETVIAGIQGYSAVVLGYTQSFCINGDNKIQFQSHYNVLSEYIDGKNFISDYLLRNNPLFNAGMAVWKKDVYDKMVKTFMEYNTIGDYCFWIELCKYGNVFISGKVLNYFRIHEKNISVNAFKNGQIFTEQIKLLQHLLLNGDITKADYANALQTNYYNFRFHKKTIGKSDAYLLKKQFSAALSFSKLHRYFYSRIFKEKLRSLF